MGKTIKQYHFSQSPLYHLTTKRKLEKVLFMAPGEARHVSDSVKYHEFDAAKPTGGSRRISAPGAKLKAWQRRIWDLVARIEKPSWVVSATKGKCYRDNARIHASNGFVLSMDIQGFYDACSREYVYRFFSEKMRCSSDVSKILTDICTVRNSIPTGSPASQSVAYFSYESMFSEIARKSALFGCTFSLYVDDMTFSSERDFAWGRLAYEVNGILRRYGHCAKKAKTRYYSASRHKVITGVALTPDGSLRAPNNLRYRILANSAKLREDGDFSIIPRIGGQIQAASLPKANRCF